MEPYDIQFADEYPIATIPDDKFWSENYAFIGYDYEKKIGFNASIGRWVKNPRLWREQFYLYLPDGTVLVHIQIGRNDDPTVPTGGSLRFICEEPGGRWRINFEGAMQHHSQQSLLADPITELRPHPVTFDVVIDHGYPVWMFPRSDNTSHGKYHYEQLGNFSAAFNFKGQDYAYQGPAYRDHSRGPRQLGDYDGHVWMQLHPENGPKFATYNAWVLKDGAPVQILSETTSMRADGFGQAQIHDPQALKLRSVDQFFDPVDINVTIEGKDYRLKGTPLTTMISALTNEFDFFYGWNRAEVDILATDQPLRLEGADGRVTGYLQRSLRLRR